MTHTVIERRENPGCLIQILWFALIGIWLGQIWIAVAWLLMLTIVGIPLGVAMLNYLPTVIALRREPVHVLITTRRDGALLTREVGVPQVNIVLRAFYFILIGWWLSAIWMELSYLVCLTIIGLPLGFWMFDRVPALVSLHRS